MSRIPRSLLALLGLILLAIPIQAEPATITESSASPVAGLMWNGALHPIDPATGLPEGAVLCKDLPAAPAQDDPTNTASTTTTVDLTCPPAIRPGAKSNACTINFIATDDTDYFVGAAGHCSPTRLRVNGIPGEVGTRIVRTNAGLNGDWAFYRIDKEDEVHIDPTMCRFGGPFAGPLGAHRTAAPGDVALHYGHGRGFGSDEDTRGRAGAPVIPLPLISRTFAFPGSVAVGDSGSPVRAATGEAIGIAIAVLGQTAPNGEIHGVVIASSFQAAMFDLGVHLGHAARVVEGDVVPDWVGHAVEA